jgi:hypothetical protein
MNVQVYVEEIFGLSGAADCNALLTIFQPQFESNKNDAEFIKNMLRRLRNAKCDESPLFAQATDRSYMSLSLQLKLPTTWHRRAVRSDDTEGQNNFTWRQ